MKIGALQERKTWALVLILQRMNHYIQRVREAGNPMQFSQRKIDIYIGNEKQKDHKLIIESKMETHKLRRMAVI